MVTASSLVFAGIAPHPPIMVPEVGHEAIAEVRTSIDAMANLTERLIRSGAETVVLISPHAPLAAEAFVAYNGPELYGDFADFRAPAASVSAQLDEELLNEITKSAAQQNLVVNRIRGHELDHGTAVPLYFLQRNGWEGRVVAFGYSFLSNDDHIRFGNSIRQAIDRLARPIAFIASGDLSHRLRVDAPAGYNPDAHLFDEEVVDAIRTSSTSRIVRMDQELRRLAGECGYRSMLVVLGVTEGLSPSCEVINYEAPFGVGYLVAQLFTTGSSDIPSAQPSDVESTDFSRALPALARQVIETFVTTGKIISPPENLDARAACFVSVKTIEGELRGCIGTIDPSEDSLGEELIANAISAATRDPRFRPIRKDELPNLKYSVDVLSAPEPTTIENLDPSVYGVIVEDQDGIHRGLLLPHLEGIDSAVEQVRIASQKAGIKPGAEITLWRFRAERYSE
jgi:MEMO1 family protein